jgi:hypothetical protein
LPAGKECNAACAPAYGRKKIWQLYRSKLWPVINFLTFLQGCRAKLSGKAAGQGCRAKLPGKAAGQGCRARLPGRAVGVGCMQWCNMLKAW